MSAETLRRAASRMRELAEETLDRDSGLDEESWYRVDSDPVVRTKWAAFSEANEADAAHIAAWHPAVALAVADWLEHQERAIEVNVEEGARSPGCHPKHPALAVARAFLGDDR